jgi:secondary thiamine-phosphate synthase enzyme
MLYRCEIEMQYPAAEITSLIAEKIAESGVETGLGVIFLPYSDAAAVITTAGKPAVLDDIFVDLNTMVPARTDYRYKDNFSKAAAHTKSALLGVSRDFIISEGAPELGKNQGFFLLDFMAPRKLEFYIKVKA